MNGLVKAVKGGADRGWEGNRKWAVCTEVVCLLKPGQHLLYEELQLKDFKQGKMEPSLVWEKGGKGLTRKSKGTEGEKQRLLRWVGGTGTQPLTMNGGIHQKLGCERSDWPFGRLGLRVTGQNVCQWVSPRTSQRKSRIKTVAYLRSTSNLWLKRDKWQKDNRDKKPYKAERKK